MSTKKQAGNEDSDVELESDDENDYSDDVSQDYFSTGDYESEDDLEKALDEFGEGLDDDDDQGQGPVIPVNTFMPVIDINSIPRSAEGLALEEAVTSDIEYEDEEEDEPVAFDQTGAIQITPFQGAPQYNQPGFPIVTIGVPQPIVQPQITLATLDQAPEIQAVTKALNLWNVPADLPGVYTDYLQPFAGETPQAFATRKAITDAIAGPRYGLNNSQIIKIGTIWANKALTNCVYSPEIEKILADISARG